MRCHGCEMAVISTETGGWISVGKTANSQWGHLIRRSCGTFPSQGKAGSLAPILKFPPMGCGPFKLPWGFGGLRPSGPPPGGMLPQGQCVSRGIRLPHRGSCLQSRLRDCDGSLLSTPPGNCVTHLPLHKGGKAKHPSGSAFPAEGEAVFLYFV